MRDLSGVTVVVTGVIGGETRRTAESKLRDAGAIVQSSVGVTTDLLVTGGKVGATKVNAARKHGAEVVPWEVIVRGSAPAEAWEEIQPESVDEGGALATLTRQEQSMVKAARAIASWRQYGPMLCKNEEMPVGDDWVFEVKWDGYRCIARVHDGAVTMTSRSAKTDYVESFPQIAEMLGRLGNMVIDGELVVFDAEGGTSMELMGGNQGGASFVVFDVLEVDGQKLTDRPLGERRCWLDVLAPQFEASGGRIAISPTFDDGDKLLAEVTERGLEGIVAKRKSSRYAENGRGWIKVKLRNQQEFVVLGWTPGEGSREGKVGAIVLGVREGDRWLYVGKCGTGQGEAEWDDLERRLGPLTYAWSLDGQTGRPVAHRRSVDVGQTPAHRIRDVVWVKPELVVDIAFQRWSKDGRLVIPSWKGIRHDKDAVDVTREA